MNISGIVRKTLLSVIALFSATSVFAEIEDLHYGSLEWGPMGEKTGWPAAEKAKTYYYLTGDVNLWSDLHKRCTLRDTYGRRGMFEGEGTGENIYIYEQDDAENPYRYFCSVEELNSKWRFSPVDESQLPEGLTGSGWLMLDLTANGATDLDGHLGRLCGQFKICCGSLETYAIGVGNQYTEDGWFHDVNNYWGNTIREGEIFMGNSMGKANFLLDTTVIDNAVIYINPSSTVHSGDPMPIYITGDYKDLYIYYAEQDADSFYAPTYTHVVESQQINNFPAVDPFVNSLRYGYEEGERTDRQIDFSWKRFDNNGAGVDYNPGGEGSATVHFPYVWRKKIPSSIIHRTPMGYVVSVSHGASDAPTPEQANYFPRVRVDCDDIWFVDAAVNLYFRFADPAMTSITGLNVYCNAWLNRYDAQSSLISPLYRYDQFRQMTLSEAGDEAHSDYLWWKSPEKLSTRFASNGHAMFTTSLGGFYPVNGHRGSATDLAALAINGADLYYVVGNTDPQLELLYNVRKNTCSISTHSDVQINAEYFNSAPGQWNHRQLDTSYDTGILYQFIIRDSDGRTIDSTDWIPEPFYLWEFGALNCAPGLYHITVKASENNIVHTVTDIYPLFQ